jgi:hypothetical protein
MYTMIAMLENIRGHASRIRSMEVDVLNFHRRMGNPRSRYIKSSEAAMRALSITVAHAKQTKEAPRSISATFAIEATKSEKS